jgi:hypothetical protein
MKKVRIGKTKKTQALYAHMNNKTIKNMYIKKKNQKYPIQTYKKSKSGNIKLGIFLHYYPE